MTDDWLKKIDNKKIVGAVMLDFSAAFDIIDHYLLLKFFMCYGLSISAILWIKIYISNRTQRGFFNESFFNVKNVKCGVPQGSSLGLLLFYIFTNDLPLALNKSCVFMYANDSILYTLATTASEITSTLNKEFQSILEWVTSNKLVLNLKLRALYLVQNIL